MKRVLLLVALLVGAALCAPARAQQCDPCDDIYFSGVFDWECHPLLPLPCNVSDLTSLFGGECNKLCDTDNYWPELNWMGLTLGANCVAVGKQPYWLLTCTNDLPTANYLPNPSTILIAMDSTALSANVPINWSFEPNQAPPFAIGNRFYECFLTVPFSAYDTVTVPGVAHSDLVWQPVPWSFALPNNPGLVGITIWSQAIAIYGSAPSLAISNTIYMTILHDI